MSPAAKGSVGFRDVKAAILERIQSKHWAPGVVLPSESELALEFRCARATVNRAMRELADAGIVDRKRRAGSRVSETPVRQATVGIPRIRDEVEGTGAVYRYARVGREVCDAPDWLAARLELDASARVVHLTCMHYADSSPFLYEQRWISLAAVPAAASVDFLETSPNEWLVAEVPFTSAEFTLYASAASDATAGFLSVDRGEPLLTIERVTRAGDRAITFARLHYCRGYRLTVRG